jgi:hypothetical protein
VKVLGSGPLHLSGGRSNGDTMDEFTLPPEPVQALAVQRAAPASWTRIGLLGIAAAALIAVAILAFGSTASPAGTLAAGTTTNPGTVSDLNGFGGGPGDHGGFGHGLGGITITAISGSKLSLATADGWTRTITVDSGTTYSKSGVTIALDDLKVGDEIGFRETHETDGSWTIDSVAVIPPHAGGEVTAVSGSTITVKGRDRTTSTITVTGSTTYTVAGNGATLADVKVGMFLVAEGTKNADGSLTATNVHAANAGDFPGFGGRGFGHWNDAAPNATAAPGATGSAG